jgi:hypothetical protein
MSDFKNTISSGKSFMNPLDIYGANILTPRKQHLSGVIPFYPYAIPLYLWGEHFQKLLNSLLSVCHP